MAEMATTLVELDYKEGLGWRIGAVVITLMAIGTVFVFSAGVEVAKGVNLSQFYESANLRKALFFPLAVAVMLVVSRIDYRRLSFDNGPVAFADDLPVRRQRNFAGAGAHTPYRLGNQPGQTLAADTAWPRDNQLSALGTGKVDGHFLAVGFLRQIRRPAQILQAGIFAGLHRPRPGGRTYHHRGLRLSGLDCPAGLFHIIDRRSKLAISRCAVARSRDWFCRCDTRLAHPHNANHVFSAPRPVDRLVKLSGKPVAHRDRLRRIVRQRTGYGRLQIRSSARRHNRLYLLDYRRGNGTGRNINGHMRYSSYLSCLGLW